MLWDRVVWAARHLAVPASPDTRKHPPRPPFECSFYLSLNAYGFLMTTSSSSPVSVYRCVTLPVLSRSHWISRRRGIALLPPQLSAIAARRLGTTARRGGAPRECHRLTSPRLDRRRRRTAPGRAARNCRRGRTPLSTRTARTEARTRRRQGRLALSLPMWRSSDRHAEIASGLASAGNCSAGTDSGISNSKCRSVKINRQDRAPHTTNQVGGDLQPARRGAHLHEVLDDHPALDEAEQHHGDGDRHAGRRVSARRCQPSPDHGDGRQAATRKKMSASANSVAPLTAVVR
jgi:hypothetical protein